MVRGIWDDGSRVNPAGVPVLCPVNGNSLYLLGRELQCERQADVRTAMVWKQQAQRVRLALQGLVMDH